MARNPALPHATLQIALDDYLDWHALRGSSGRHRGDVGRMLLAFATAVGPERPLDEITREVSPMKRVPKPKHAQEQVKPLTAEELGALLAQPNRLYRAFPANEEFNASQRSAVEVPIVLAGGDHSFGKLTPRVAAALRSHGCANVTIEAIKNSGHYVVDEQPKSVAGLIERYASR